MSARHAILLVAAVIVAAASLLVTGPTNEDTFPESQSGPESASSDPLDETAGDSINSPAPTGSENRTNSQGPTESMQVQSAYDVVFGEPDPSNPLWEAHLAFTVEPRNEAWAITVESSIRSHIANSGANDWATVDKIECRSTICEVLGLMPDAMLNPELDPNNLLGDGFGVGWWQGVGQEVMTRQHTYDGEGITRFMLIIVQVNEERYGQPD